jgi:TRAP-type transport system small permease protein
MVFVKWIDKLNHLLQILLGLVLATMTLVVFYQVVVRFVLTALGEQISAPWTEELARYLMIWMVFVGGAVASRKADSLAVEALVQAVPPRIGRVVKIASHLLSLVFYAIIFMIGFYWTQFGGTETAPVMKVPMIYVYSSMSFGAVLTILNTITLLVDTYVNRLDILEVSNEEVEEALSEFSSDKKEAAV